MKAILSKLLYAIIQLEEGNSIRLMSKLSENSCQIDKFSNSEMYFTVYIWYK